MVSLIWTEQRTSVSGPISDNPYNLSTCYFIMLLMSGDCTLNLVLSVILSHHMIPTSTKYRTTTTYDKSLFKHNDNERDMKFS